MTLTEELETQLQDMANRLRIDSIQSTNAAKSGYLSFNYSYFTLNPKLTQTLQSIQCLFL
jgi:hypothetical protein